MTMLKRFAAYCRVSTENQRDEKTIELQVESLAKYASEHDIEIVKFFKDDGVSGGLESRPELIELMKFLESSPEIAGVLIYKLDRLARDLYIQEGLIKEFSKLNKQVISTLEPDLDSGDPFRTAFRQMLGVFAEFEKAMITLRMKNGRNSAVAKGKWHGGQLYGYNSNGKGELIINQYEADVIIKIYKLKRYQKLSHSKIAKILNDELIPTKRKNTHWHSFTIKKILGNPIYRGKLRYLNKIYDGQHQTILK